MLTCGNRGKRHGALDSFRTTPTLSSAARDCYMEADFGTVAWKVAVCPLSFTTTMTF